MSKMSAYTKQTTHIIQAMPILETCESAVCI